MGCFCRQSLLPLSQNLLQLNVSYAEPALPTRSDLKRLAAAAIAGELSRWLAGHGLPAAPWQPDPAWLEIPMPQLALNAQAMATISAFAQVRAQALAQFGIDLLIPAQQSAFARIVATLNVRLTAMASLLANPTGLPGGLAFSASAWIKLASLNDAIDMIMAALEQELLPVPPSTLSAFTMPGGLPFQQWLPFLRNLRALAPLIAASAQLNMALSASFAAELSASLRVMKSIVVPALPAALFGVMGTLTAAVSATARLQASLGIDSTLALGFPAVRQAVMVKLAAMMQALPPGLMSAAPAWPSQPTLAEAEAFALAQAMALLGQLPAIPFCPTNLAASAVVRAAASMDAQAVASINWQVPAMSAIPLLSAGLPACSFAATLDAAFSAQAVLPAPCGSGCDAAKIMRAASAALPVPAPPSAASLVASIRKAY